jgi:L-iditol 2-dehydrogenase
MKAASPKKVEVGLEEAVLQTKVVVPSRMTAAVLYGSEDLRIEQIDVPAVAMDEVLLRVRLALTDGTDLKVWKRGYHAKMIQPPAVFGHEVVGEIVAMGKRVDPRWRLGMRVIAANSAPCLRCYHCRRGQENLCDDLLFNNGAYAEYMRIPGRIVRENMLEVPHAVDDHSAALAEPLACVLRGVHEMEVRTGDATVVIGCGPIGLMFVRMLTRRGVRVIALARREGREVRVFVMGDGVLAAHLHQKVPAGYYNVEVMLGGVTRHGGQVAACGTCLDARGIAAAELAEGARRGTLEELAEWTGWAQQVLVF